MGYSKSSARRFKFFGVIFLLAGLAALLVPPVAGLAVALILGWLFVIGGGLQALSALTAPRSEVFWVKLLWSMLYMGVGLWVVLQPTQGMQALALAVGLLFALDAAVKLYFAWQRRGRGYGGWIVIGGLLSALLAGLLFAGWPEASATLLGILVGVNLLTNGVLALVVAQDVRDSGLVS
ncbi:MAG: DUF308 domain-containing protein [Xanthomonadales bacterium]|nr:DUF308 domain-containing protein [Xanthomonadales bacterium]